MARKKEGQKTLKEASSQGEGGGCQKAGQNVRERSPVTSQRAAQKTG
jgi:hypothetical protein